MALRLRRGTNIERQTATFSEGELIYVTDYDSAGVSPLWIGDGSTVGGNEVETGGTPSLELNDLTDVNASPIENNILVYQSGQWTSVDPATLGISGSGIIDGQEYNISINGSVIGSDSSIIVDSSTQVVTANLFVGSGAGLTDINLVDLDDVFAFGAQINDVLTYDGTGWIPSAPVSQFLEGIEYNINIQGDVIGLDSSILLNSATNTLTGSVVGDLKGSVFGDDSSIIVDAVNRVINIDTIQTGSNVLTVNNSIPASSTNLKIRSNDDKSVLAFERQSNIDIESQDVLYGNITFSRNDINGDKTTTTIFAKKDGFFIAQDPTGNFSEASLYLTFTSTGLAIGKFVPNAKLDVAGGAIFDGDVQAAAFKGSLVADDSTTIIDAINGTIVAQGFIQFGSYTDTEIGEIVPSNGMVYYNVTDNRFRGYQNGSWINLDDGTAA